MVAYALLIPLFPLVGFLVILLAGIVRKWVTGDIRIADRLASGVGILTVGLSFILSWLVLFEVLGKGPGSAYHHAYEWLDVGFLTLWFGFYIDAMTAMMLVVVTTVALMVQIFSTGYMAGDLRFPRFYSYLCLFTMAMLILVLANNLVQLFIAWELMGLASYLLIGFWFEKPSAMRAAKKAFMVTRVGDVGLFFGMALLLGLTNTLNFVGLVVAHPDGTAPGLLEQGWLSNMGVCAGPAILTTTSPIFGVAVAGSVLLGVAALLIFCGSIGKSAQFPLHVWLPDAMEGPTPVSALIHAATMVAAGVYLVARMYPVFDFGGVLSVAGTDFRPLSFVALIGTITALMAALIALTQSDIKRILAYSTISQLGFMMAGLGCGGVVSGGGQAAAAGAAEAGHAATEAAAHAATGAAGHAAEAVGQAATALAHGAAGGEHLLHLGFTAGMFHLMTHAFFKGLLFLGSGSVIHGTGTQDVWEMGGLRRFMPKTLGTYFCGYIALAGVPFVAAGFYSKDLILDAAWEFNPVIFWVLVFTAGLTAFYMTRQMMLVFGGEWSGGPAVVQHGHTDPQSDPHGSLHAEDYSHIGHEQEEQPGPEAVPVDARPAPVVAAHDPVAGDDAAHDHAAHSHDDHGHGHHGQPHESPPSMLIPLYVLAALAIVSGLVGIPGWLPVPGAFAIYPYLHYTRPGMSTEFHPHFNPMVFIPGFVAPLVGIALGYVAYRGRKFNWAQAERLTPLQRTVYALSYNKLYFDEFYWNYVFIRPLFVVTNLLKLADIYVVDAIVRAVAMVGLVLSQVGGMFDRFIIDGVVNGVGRSARAGGNGLRYLQSGQIQNYILMAFAGVVLLVWAVLQSNAVK